MNCALKLLEKNSRIRFIIVGSGIEKEILYQKAKNLKISNDLLENENKVLFQDYEELKKDRDALNE